MTNDIQKTCPNCSQPFEIRERDQDFYQTIEVPEPTHCPDCRQQRRLAWCGERKLYQRTCDLTKEKILSMFPADVPFPVYHVREWWSDKWDAMQYGQEIDFDRPFFEQWYELLKKVPQYSLNVTFNTLENSEYVNYAGNLKNCYLIFDTDYSRDCFYGYTVNKSKDVVDSFKVNECELCYECIDCNNCYDLKYSTNCRNCNSSWFLKNCIGCSNCFGCINLQRKEYHYYNQPLSKEEYEKRVAAHNVSSYSGISEVKDKVNQAFLKFPHKFMRGFNNQNCTGDGVFNCKNTFDSYDCLYCEDCSYCYSMSFQTKSSYDIYQFGENVERCYESVVLGYGGFNVKFSYHCPTGNNNLDYCYACMSSKDLFGCIGLKHKQYCIFNKQYSPEEYSAHVVRIKEHMQKNGEYGEFFPAKLSPFYYNDTTAQDYYPLTKEQAEANGLNWKDPDQKEYQKQTFQIPDDIKDVRDDITSQILACEACNKNYKIVEQELKFYRNLGVPIPHKCFDCRHLDRMKLRNPQKLWKRNCQKCNKEVESAYASDRPEIVHCEECYLNELQ